MPVPAVGKRRDEWARMIASLESSSDLITKRQLRRILSELSSYQALSPAEYYPEARCNLQIMLNGLKEARGPTADGDTSVYRASGEARARQRVTSGDLLQAWRLLHEVLRSRAHEVAPEGEHRDAILLEAHDLIMDWIHRGMVASAAGHRQVEQRMLRSEDRHRANLVRSLLLGDITASQLQASAEVYGIDPSERYHAIRTRPSLEAGPDTEGDAIERYFRLVADNGRRRGMVVVIDGDICGFMADLPHEPPPVPVGVSSAMPLLELKTGFHLASRALEAAAALRIEGLFTVGDLGVLSAVVADHDVGDIVGARYVEPLERLGRSGLAVLETVERYLDNGCRLEATAEDLFVHVNTVRYRLKRFEAVTHCSLRETRQLVEVWWALQRRRIR